MNDVLDDNLEFDENSKKEIGKIMLLTGAFLVLSMILLNLLKVQFPKGFIGGLVFIILMLLSRNMTHKINTIDKNIREFMLGVYVFITFFLAQLFYKTIILSLIIEKLGWSYHLRYSVYSSLVIAGFAFVFSYFIIHKIRTKPILFPIVLIILYILFLIIM